MSRCDSYIPGQCTRGACDLASWVPDGLGNGGQWAANAPAHGLHVTMVPTVGAIVSYCPGDGYSPFGHCGLVTAVYADGTFMVREMNFVAAGVYDDRHSTQGDVCGFVLPPGVDAGQGGVDGVGGMGGVGPDGLPLELTQAWQEITWWANSGLWTLVQQTDGWRQLALQAGS